MSKPRYKAHYGKSQPVDDDVMVEVVFRDGDTCRAPAGDWGRMMPTDSNWWCWDSADDCDITAYRILEDEQ